MSKIGSFKELEKQKERGRLNENSRGEPARKKPEDSYPTKAVKVN